MNQLKLNRTTALYLRYRQSVRLLLIIFVLAASQSGFSQNQDLNFPPQQVSKVQSVEGQILSLLSQIEAGTVQFQTTQANRDRIIWLSVALTRPLERRIEAYIYQRLHEVSPKLQELIGQLKQDAGLSESHQGMIDRERLERAVSMIGDLQKQNELKSKAGKTHADYRLIFAYDIRIRSELMKVQNQYAGSRYALFCAGIF